MMGVIILILGMSHCCIYSSHFVLVLSFVAVPRKLKQIKPKPGAGLFKPK